MKRPKYVAAMDLFGGYEWPSNGVPRAVATTVDLAAPVDISAALLQEEEELGDLIGVAGSSRPLSSGPALVIEAEEIDEETSELLFISGSPDVSIGPPEVIVPVEGPPPIEGPYSRYPRAEPERGVIARAVVSCERTPVLLQRAGSNKVAVIPQSVAAASRFRLLTVVKQPLDILQPEMLGKPSKAPHGGLLFPISSVLTAPDPNDSQLVKGLSELGFACVLAPSFGRWLPKMHRRIQREMTPFDMPIVVDGRPLYDRMEIGLVVRCTHNHGDFVAGVRYVVVKTDQIIEGGGADDDGNEMPDEAAIGFRPASLYEGEALVWGEHGDLMEDYFEMDTDIAEIYDPANAFPAKYPELYQQALRRIEEAGRPLFEYIKGDMAQAVNYRDLVLGHSPRMGKTSNAIAYAEATGVKNCLIVTVNNGVLVVAKELERLGITDYKILKKLKDIAHPAKYHLTSHNWLKYHAQFKKGTNYRPPAERWMPAVANCPHCNRPLEARLLERLAIDATASKMTYILARKGDRKLDNELSVPLGTPRLRLQSAYDPLTMASRPLWGTSYGYLCRNPHCAHEGYVDLGRKMHSLCVAQGLDKHTGLQCRNCGQVHGVQMRNRYKAIRKRYSMIVIDEVHKIKSNTAMQSRAIRAMTHARRRISMSGTIMPNHPSDAFYPFSWTFGNNNHKFPFAAGEKGMAEFREEYTETVSMTIRNRLGEGDTGEHTRRKVVPYIKKPIQFWKWKAPRILARNYNDPQFISSLAAAGQHFPRFTVHPVELTPEPAHALLLFATFSHFERVYREYAESVRLRNEQTGSVQVVNSARVIAKMSLMRFAATVPGVINDKLARLNYAPIYHGPRGGIKMAYIHDLVAERTLDNKKVVLFSGHKAMQQLMAEELVYYNPILFDTSWNPEKREEMFERFQQDDARMLWICGPQSVGEAVDLSRADTIITPDLMWSPGSQMQAWSRTLTARPDPREVKCYVLNCKYSIDGHVYGTFYSKIAAAEQAIHGRVINRAQRGFDLVSFVDQVIAERQNILQWLIESGHDMERDYLPMMHSLHQLESRGEEEIETPQPGVLEAAS
jgi:hypothetical protein